jgi:hypothetical protein
MSAHFWTCMVWLIFGHYPLHLCQTHT